MFTDIQINIITIIINAIILYSWKFMILLIILMGFSALIVQSSVWSSPFLFVHLSFVGTISCARIVFDRVMCVLYQFTLTFTEIQFEWKICHYCCCTNWIILNRLNWKVTSDKSEWQNKRLWKIYSIHYLYNTKLAVVQCNEFISFHVDLNISKFN